MSGFLLGGPKLPYFELLTFLSYNHAAQTFYARN